jgi:hypothetical protein
VRRAPVPSHEVEQCVAEGRATVVRFGSRDYRAYFREQNQYFQINSDYDDRATADFIARMFNEALDRRDVRRITALVLREFPIPHRKKRAGKKPAR